MRAIATSCEGVSLWTVGRIFGVDKDTVLRWWKGRTGKSQGAKK